MVSHRKNGYWQKAGVDRSVILENSKQILVDEKIRRKDYGDIALEVWSDVENKKEGWICKPLMADYIAYAFLQSKKCYLFPVVQLQYAWKNNRENWTRDFGLKEAKNNNYTTVFCPVPMQDLFPEIGKCLRCDFS